MWSTLVVAACAVAYFYHHRSRPARSRSQAYAHDLGKAWVLLAHDRPEEAIDALDGIDTRTLDAATLARWLNLKANALALTGRSDEALDLLDDLQSLADTNDATMQLCLVGNRGVAHLFAGRLPLAAQLLDDTEAAAQALAATDPAFAAESVAETWWWRAEIAQREGDLARRRECLTRAAAQGESLYARKAQGELAKPQP